ncbi:MAG: signal peptidase I [Thermoprotei archaeon]|nr:MAG: signal peptidase I [Thermoprotei archaeon]
MFYSRYSAMIVSSDSMAPYLNVGDIVIVDRYPAKIDVGDVIVFIDPSSRLCVHRVIEIRNSNHAEVYVTRGDSNPTPDPWWLTRNEIIGKVVFKIPGLGRLILNMSKLMGPLMIIVGALLMLIAFTVPNLGEKRIELNVEYLKTLSKILNSGIEVEYAEVDLKGRLRIVIAHEEYIIDEHGIRPLSYFTKIPLLEQASKKLRVPRKDYMLRKKEIRDDTCSEVQLNKYKGYQKYSEVGTAEEHKRA